MLALVAIAAPVLLATEVAGRGWLGIIDPVLDRFYGAKIGKHHLEVLISQILIHLYGHDRI